MASVHTQFSGNPPNQASTIIYHEEVLSSLILVILKAILTASIEATPCSSFRLERYGRPASLALKKKSSRSRDHAKYNPGPSSPSRFPSLTIKYLFGQSNICQKINCKGNHPLRLRERIKIYTCKNFTIFSNINSIKVTN